MPALEALLYPGVPVAVPSLLVGQEVLPLHTGAPDALPLGHWRVGAGGRAGALDGVLGELGASLVGERQPVVAVGSNACPAQVAHKLRTAGLSGIVPMVPCRVTGIRVGLSGHIGRPGYVAASPYPVPGGACTLVVSWLDVRQLAALDATEYPNYGRALLPADRFPVVLPTGEPLAAGACLYFNARGLLAHPDGTPRRTAAQAAVLSALLAESAALRALFGNAPESWVRRAAADAALRARGTAVFREEGWLLPEPGFLPYAVVDPTPQLREEGRHHG